MFVHNNITEKANVTPTVTIRFHWVLALNSRYRYWYPALNLSYEEVGVDGWVRF